MPELHGAQPNTMVESREDTALGSIVAFEGHPETISTQLRLLPTSPQILILPGVQCYLQTSDPDQTFEAHDYIRLVHNAAKTRNETARSFLHSATPANKRLVFLNGGTPSAQTLCIKHIMRHETEGDDAEAEAMFNFLVKEGLAGLESQAMKWRGEGLSGGDLNEGGELAEPRELGSPFSGRDQRDGGSQSPLASGNLDEDPTTRAMRAAEALDRQTANLQPSNDLDLTLAPRRRSVNLPMYGYSDNFGDAAPFFVFGGRRKDNNDDSTEEAVVDEPPSTSTSRFSVTHYEDEELDLPILTGYTDSKHSPSCAGESYGPTFLHSPPADPLPTSRTEAFDIRSPGEVVFGEASVIDMRSGKSPITRIRSLDRIDPVPSVYRDLFLPRKVAEEKSKASRRPYSCAVVPGGSDPSASRLDLIDGPRTVLVRSKHRSAVNLAPVPADKKRKPHGTYVDRGTDAEVEAQKTEPFIPVLPVTEDLVVSLKEEVSDALLERIVKSFRAGSYPILSSSCDASETDTMNDQLPSTPGSHSTDSGEETPKATERTEPAVASPSLEVDEYDPFAYVQKPPASTSPVLTMTVKRPPTPAETPAPSFADSKDEKFHEFKVTSNQTAVATQNALRSVLGMYFPPEAQGYHQFNFPLLPELEGLWKPIFREAEPGSPRVDNRRMDQIVAIGSQKGVKKEFSSSVIGLLDKLGSKPSGISRSGRLDFRYLLANAIQAFTSQPLANQTSDNPFTNPYLLATLIIPHLETYLALHSEVRYLLLEYPPEHTSTILALQKLVGVDLMKVAQIVNSASTDLGPFTHIRGASIGSISEEKSQNPLGKPVGSTNEDPPDLVHKANFLLTSDAGDDEIATFISTVGKILREVSQFYTPEEVRTASPAPTRRPVTRTKQPPPLTSNFSTLARGNGAPGNNVASPAPSVRPPSISETVRSAKTARTGRSTKNGWSKRRPTTDGAESFMTFDPAEDSDYDMEERRLMPIFMQKQSRKPKPNSRKALKFLGLA